VKTTRYPEAGRGVAEMDAEGLAVAEFVLVAGAELHAERSPRRVMTAG
jgi:hypothetical protein